jgi:membrane protein implicated in regulation of membrane protease activity
MTPEVSVAVMSAGAAALGLAVWWMRRLNLRAQFLVLLALAIAVGFVLMIAVQIPTFPLWLAAVLVTMVLIASPFATRIFMRSIEREKSQQERDLESR